jgi:hypothetical protein
MKAKALAEASGDSSVMTCTSGMINAKTIETILALITAVFEWLTESQKNEKKVIVCKDCGYWERI